MIVLEKETKKNIRQLSGPAIVGITLFGVFLVAFFSYHAYMFVQGNELKTEIAFSDAAVKTYKTKMYVVRDEKIISASGNNVVSAVKDGARVGVNDTVAYSFSDNTSAGNIIRMNEINELLDYYSTLMGVSSHVAGDTTTHDEKIMNNLYSFSSMVSSGDFTSLSDKLTEIRDVITSKQTAMGIKLDLTETINSLQAEYKSLSANTKNYKEIKSGGTGYYISGTDGFENILNYSDVDEWTIADVENALGATPAVTNSNVAGRLVHSYYWYLACITETSAINSIREGKRYSISFPDSAVEDITAQVYSISSDRETGKSLVVFKCNTMNEELAAIRSEWALINIEEIEGFRVDNRAIRANEDNEKGVYVVSGGRMYFRKIKIVYSTDDYSIVADPYKDSDITKNDYPSQYLHLYDEYIVEGRDLSHGRLISQ